jgi:hypothetical protein
VPEPPGADTGAPTTSDPFVFVTDSTPDGERLGAVLRARGYSVADVPQAQLPGRTRLGLPSLLLFATDAPNALDTLREVLELHGSGKLGLLLLGDSEAELQEAANSLQREVSAMFARPLDVYAILRTVEALIGAPSGLPGGSLMPPSRPSTRPPSSRPSGPPSSDGKGAPVSVTPPTRPSSAPPAQQERARARPPPRPASGSQPSEPTDLPPVIDSSLPPDALSLYPPDSLRPWTDEPGPDGETDSPRETGSRFEGTEEPSLPPLSPMELGDSSQHLPGQIPEAEISPGLSQLLRQAEERVRRSIVGSGRPSVETLSGDNDAETLIPHDVLLALEQPLDGTDDAEAGNAEAAAGTRSGSEAGRTGLQTGSGEKSNRGPLAGPEASPQREAATDGSTPVEPGALGTAGMNGGLEQTPSTPGSVSQPTPPSELADATPSGGDLEAGITGPPGRRRETPTSAPPALHKSRPPTAPGSAAPQMTPTPTPPAISARAAPTPLPASAGGTLGTGETGAQNNEATDGQGTDRPAATLSPDELADSRTPAGGPTPLVLRPASGYEASPLDAELASEPASTVGWRWSQPPVPESVSHVEVPTKLGPRDAARALARIIRARYTGALALEDEHGIRRIVFREGDFVTAASSVEGESLVAFLVERGALPREVGERLGRKLPPFGRHASAALIAHGHLRQDELWPVLRAHAEWLVGRALMLQHAVASLEAEVPARLEAEPAVFGGATGAEVFVELVRRVLDPAEALERLGGGDARLTDGPATALLGEASLPEHELAFVNRAKSSTLKQVVQTAHSPDMTAVLFALTELGVLQRTVPSAAPGPPARFDGRPVDQLDDAAGRARILARKALVDEGDYFALLGVRPNATAYEIRQAYVQLRHEFEPHRILTGGTADLRDEVEQIVEVLEEAYDVLRDQVRRERYRRALEAAP